MAPLIDEATLEAKISPLIADYANALDTIKQAMTAVSDIAQELEEVKGMNSELSKQLDGSFTGLVDVAENFRSQRDALSHVKNSYGVAVREQQQARRAAAAAAAGGDNEEEGDGGPGVSVVDMFKRGKQYRSVDSYLA